ncbi:MAG: helix-turn-helix domain-containing protein [Sphingorhabdus sp.]
MDDMPTEQILQVDVGFTGERLRQLRRRFDLTQLQMAAKLGVPKSTYVGWELETSVPPVSLYDSIASQFGPNMLHYLMGLVRYFESDFRHIDVRAGRSLAKEVKLRFERAGYDYDAGLVFETTIRLLELPEAMRLFRLDGIEQGLTAVRRIASEGAAEADSASD